MCVCARKSISGELIEGKMRLRLWLLGVSALKKILEVKFLDLGFKGNTELDCALKLKNVIRRRINIVTDSRMTGRERYLGPS